MKLEFPIFNGFTYDWYQLATESFVNNKIFNINSNTSGQLNSNRLSGYPSNASVFLRGDGNWVAPPNVGTVTSVGITGSTGLGVTGSPITSSGTINLTLGSELQALSAFASTGLMIRTGSNSYTGRTLTQSTGISITNGNGVSGNPTIAIGIIPIANLSGYPGNSAVYLRGDGVWNNLNITTTATTVAFEQPVWMKNFALWFRSPSDVNHGISYNATIGGLKFVGFSGFSWATGTSGATERMRLTSSGLDLNSSKLLNVLTPTVSTDGANKSYVDSAVSSANTKLQYFGSWDSVYPIYVTRSMYINNSYSSPIREYGTYGFLNGNGNTGTATDSPIYDIMCNSRIRASEFNAWSSKNIKNILSIGKKAGEEASKILQDIPIVKYNYKDPIVDGKGEFFGVISEEILDYLPNYVTTNEFRFTPNIMMFGKLNSIDYQYFTILLQDDKTLDASFIGKKIQILKDNSSISGILESIENKFLTVKLESKVIITEKDLDVFVYGSYEDCPTVSLKHLSELSLCALVNCIERINKLEQIN